MKESDYLFNLAQLALANDDIQHAIIIMQHAVEISPNDALLVGFLGELLIKAHRYEEAIAQYQKAITIQPQDTIVFFNLGILLYQTDRAAEAVVIFQKVISLCPEWSAAWMNLGSALDSIGHRDQAFECWQKALALDPEDASAHFNCGRHYETEGNIQKAEEWYERTISLSPQNANAWYRLAGINIRLQKWENVVSCYKKVIELEPDHDRAHYNIAVALKRLEKIDEAAQYCRHALKITPQFSEATALLFKLSLDGCDWSFADQLGPVLDRQSAEQLKHGIKTAEDPMVSIRRHSDPCLNLSIAKAWSTFIEQLINNIPKRPIFNHKPHDRRNVIKIGYISSDFKDHAVAHHVRGLINCHDRNKFAIYLYACNANDGSYYRRQFTALSDHFIELEGLDDVCAAQRIFDDGIDILVDLTGHTRGGRMGILALRPAPIQVSYLGFIGSSGSSFIDYLIADAVVIPAQQADYYTEKLVYLPDCYQVNDNQLTVSSHCFDRSELGFSADNLILCNFNQPYKIDRDTFTSWLEVMKMVPDSRLWLLGQNQTAMRNLRKAAESAGISSQRIKFSGALRIDLHLARLKLADIALDTFPYNGGATTANALWAGVPVLTLMGSHFASRMSASALMAMGLPELVVHSKKDYIKTAVELLCDRTKLNHLRSKIRRLREQSALFNTKKFTLNLERAFEIMLKRFNNSLPSSSIVIESDNMKASRYL